METLNQLEWEAAENLLKQAQRIVILGHTPPDADAVSSVVSVAMLCERYDKETICVVENIVTDEYLFIPLAHTIQPAIDNASWADLIVIVDSSASDIIGETGKMLLAQDTPKLIIDHHASNTLYGDVHLVRSTAVSATEVIYDWLMRLGQRLTSELAEALLIGILSDTQLLTVGNLVDSTFAKIANLVATGLNYRAIVEQMRRSKTPLGRWQLSGLGLYRSQQEAGVAWTWIEAEEFAAYNLPAGQTLMLVDTLIRTEGVVISAEFAASHEGNVKLSLRAADGYDVGHIATQLGGGGHQRAGGCLLHNMTTTEAMAQVLPLLQAEARKNTKNNT